MQEIRVEFEGGGVGEVSFFCVERVRPRRKRLPCVERM